MYRRCPCRPGLAGCDEFISMPTAQTPPDIADDVQMQLAKEKQGAETLKKLAPILLTLLFRG